MNALEFLIANADRVLNVYYGNVHETYGGTGTKVTGSPSAGPYQDEFNTDVCLLIRPGEIPRVFFCQDEVRDLKLNHLKEFGADIEPHETPYKLAVATVTEKASLYSFSIDEPVSDANADLCMSVERLIQLMRIVDDADRNENRKFFYRAGTSGYVRTKAVYTIRKSVLLKEAGGSTAEDRNGSLDEPRKTSFVKDFLSKNAAIAECLGRAIDQANANQPYPVRVTVQAPGAPLDKSRLRRIRIHGTAKVEFFTPEQIAASQNANSKSFTEWAAAPYAKMAEDLKDVPYASVSGRLSGSHENHIALPRKELGQAPATVNEVIDHADKQYAEEHAKQLASLDALIASPSMPDACKTLLRGCRHQFERADTYDQLGGERSMDKIVPMFNILYGKDLTKEQGWMFMMLVKAVRSANGKYSADSYEDGGSYFGLADEDAKKERK